MEGVQGITARYCDVVSNCEAIISKSTICMPKSTAAVRPAAFNIAT